MGYRQRSAAIFRANIQAPAPEPESNTTMEQDVQGLQKALADTRTLAASHLATALQLKQQDQRLQDDIRIWLARAEQALLSKREDLARLALIEKKRRVEKAAQLAQQALIIGKHLTVLRQDAEHLTTKIRELTARQRQLTLRGQVAHARLQLRRRTATLDVDASIDRLEELHLHDALLVDDPVACEPARHAPFTTLATEAWLEQQMQQLRQRQQRSIKESER